MAWSNSVQDLFKQHTLKEPKFAELDKVLCSQCTQCILKENLWLGLWCLKNLSIYMMKWKKLTTAFSLRAGRKILKNQQVKEITKCNTPLIITQPKYRNSNRELPVRTWVNIHLIISLGSTKPPTTTWRWGQGQSLKRQKTYTSWQGCLAKQTSMNVYTIW